MSMKSIILLSLVALSMSRVNVTDYCYETVVNGTYEYNCEYPEDLT